MRTKLALFLLILAGSHIGGFDPFTIDVTEYVDAGDNELVVAVSDPTSSGEQPRGNPDFHKVTMAGERVGAGRQWQSGHTKARRFCH